MILNLELGLPERARSLSRYVNPNLVVRFGDAALRMVSLPRQVRWIQRQAGAQDAMSALIEQQADALVRTTPTAAVEPSVPGVLDLRELPVLPDAQTQDQRHLVSSSIG
jgi:hypothetical protein